jgi:hypothetical protein
MLVYPQLRTGALGQFPILKTRDARTVINTASDGTTIKLADPAGGSTEWELTYEDLANDEIATLFAFFASAEGTLNGFTFLDPAGNLLAWSETLDNTVWQRDPFLSLLGGQADPNGGAGAWEISNTGTGSQALSQTIEVPGGYQYCMSAYVRGTTPTGVTLGIGSRTIQRQAGALWSRIVFTGTGDPLTTSTAFVISVDAGGSIQLYGPQVEPQSGTSGYKISTSGGVYPNAHLRNDLLAITATDINRHSCKVKIINVDHL